MSWRLGWGTPRAGRPADRAAGARGRADRVAGRALDDARAARARAADAGPWRARARASRRRRSARRPCARARRETARELGAPLSAEQREALRTITGEGGVSVLVGQAGTGKGVVISTAAQRLADARAIEVIGTAVAGATAERLGAGREARARAYDRLAAGRVENEQLALDSRTVVVMDEAGMADTQRLSTLPRRPRSASSKLVLVGDQAQLPAIGAGGMFDAIQDAGPDGAADGGAPRRAALGARGVAAGPRGRARRGAGSATWRTIGCTSPTPESRPQSGWSRLGPRPAASTRASAR